MAGLWGSLMTAINAGATTFRREYFGTGSPGDQAAATFDARKFRYELDWAYYDNTAYDRVRLWATQYKTAYGLYKYTRSIYNPAHRLGEFYASHLMGGQLDPLAGDGEAVQSAIPIADASDAARAAIALVWAASRWQIEKGVWTRRGAVLGDHALMVEDDPTARSVRLRPLHPGVVKHVERDAGGRLARVLLEEPRPDPEQLVRLPIGPGRSETPAVAWWSLLMTREAGGVRFATYRNGQPYAWGAGPAEWSEPYQAIPLVLGQHVDMGEDWGWSEGRAEHAKFREVDDQASKLSDQIRKTVEPRWFYAGVQAPDGETAYRAGISRPARDRPTPARPEPGRDEIPAVYADDPAAKPTPLVAPLQIADALAHIAGLVEQIELDYPELRLVRARTTADSGTAIRRLREPVEAKVRERRAGYDAALVEAQRMALAIGGGRGYPGFEPFDFGDAEADATMHRIEAERPVFGADPAERLEQEAAFWAAMKVARDCGATARVFLARNGWDEDAIADFEKGDAAERAEALAAVEAARAAGRGPAEPETPPEADQ